MGYIRKALSITTLGLSGLVLDDDSTRKAKTATRKGRPQKPKAKPKVTARAKPSLATAERPKSRPKRAKRKAVSKAARSSPTARAKPPAAARPKPPRPPEPKSQAVSQPTAVKAPPSSGTVIALERIAKLHALGSLTDQEFASAKARVLGTAPAAPATGAAHAAFPAIEANVAAARRLEGATEPDRDASETTAPGGVRGI
jgi:hypothetical protein